MERHRLLLFFMVLLFHLSAEQISIDKAPKIMTDNGDLIFETTMAKSIRFKTDGGGQIRLNDIDLAAVSNELKTIRTSVDQIQNLKKCNCELINSKLDNNLAKITALENRLQTSTSQIISLTTIINDVKEKVQFDDCANNPCHNGGICVDKYNSFKCICTENFKGVHCDEDVDECVQLAGTELGCQNNARCENLEGGFRCICTPKWSGVLCHSPVNGCAGSTNVDLCGHGTCISDNTPGNLRNFKCICETGWKMDDITKTCIIDIDECHHGRHPCSENPLVQCSNLPGHFTCGECPAGFEGNGFQCRDIDECANVNVQMCNANENCVNVIGSYRCQCIPGMVKDVLGICRRENVCEVRNGGCNVNAICTRTEFTPEGRYCRCNSGFVGNGIGIDGCSQELPSNATNRGYRRCIRRQLCENGGTCIPTNNYYRCQCASGFSGSDCRTVEINQCNQNPCQNGGQCVFVPPSRYLCHCRALFSGQNCEIEQTECGGNLIPLREEQNISLVISQSSQLSRSFRFPCTWTIIANSEQFIQILPTTLQLKGPCSEEYIKLQEKSALDGPIESIGTYCSSDNFRPRKFNTSGSILLIETTLKKTFTENHGFTLRIIPTDIPVESVDCCRCLNYGNVMTNKTAGIFQSPDFPLKYPLNHRCIMSFERNFGDTYRIELEIKTLDLGEKISNCQDSDILKIILVKSGEINITACNQEQFYNRKFVTSGFKVIFSSDSRTNNNANRFKLTWRKSSVQDPCGGNIGFNPQGLIQSPALGADVEAYCTWKVRHFNISHLVYLRGYFDNWDYGDCSVYLKIINIDSNHRQTVVWETCQTQQMFTELSEQFDGDIIVIFRKSLGIHTPPFRITLEYTCGSSRDMDRVTEYQFESSNYPDNYESNLNCVYKFSAKTRKILVTFLDFDVNDTYPCNSDYLEISGSDSYRVAKKRFCNGNLEELIPISKNEFTDKLVMVFKTNSSISGRGFRAKVNVYECGGSVFVRKRNYIAYPESYLNRSLQHINHQYGNSENCTWNIYSPPGTLMFIIFDHFHLEAHPECRYDYLLIQYENTTKRFCGNDVKTLFTTKNRLKVQFVSDHSISGEGFYFRIYVSQSENQCHQVFEASDGIIYSPQINTLSRPYLCYYNIKVPRGRKVLLNITIAGVEEFSSSRTFMHPCYGESSLKILNGNVGSTEIATICRQNAQQQTYETSSNIATVIYLVPLFASALEYNFTIAFSSFDGECGSIHSDNAGQIASPNYPLYAPLRSYCRWEIRTKPGNRIQIRITHTRSGSVNETQDCNNATPVLSFVTITKEIKVNCTEQARLPYLFDDQVVQIIFKNLLNTKYRFRLSYKKVCTYTTDAANGRIESNIISSPYKCVWTLTGLRGGSIAIEIDQFDLPAPINGTCISYVEISDSSRNTILRKSCGNELEIRKFTVSNLPVQITHSIHKFTALNVLQAYQGLVLEYQSQGCIQYINYDPSEYSNNRVQKGTIVNKNYPEAVTNTDCLWHFQTVPGYSVKLIFDIIELDSFLNCTEGPILMAWEDQDMVNDLVLQICDRISNGKPMVFQSSTHKLYLKFSSAKDSNGGQRKFHGTYEFVNNSCEYEMSLSQGVIKSPNYPGIYPRNLRCRWNLKVREGMAVHLKFTDFQLENSNCNYDYVELFSQVNNEMVRIKRLCGKMRNASNFQFESISNQMLVTFRTDSDIDHKGFYATFYEGCGGLLRATESKQYIYSPNYPNVYTLPDGSCEWTLVANVSDPGSRIFFYTTGLEGMTSNPSANCSMTQNGLPENSLTIIDGLEESNSVKAILCQTLPSIPVISTGHYLKIILRSTSGHAIFKASFGTGFSECGHEFYLNDGIFTSPFYPQYANADLDCAFVIRSVPGSEIDLIFEDFTRQSSEASMFHDFIDIRYGPNETSPLVGRFYTLNDLNNATSNRKFNKSLWIRLRSQDGDLTNNVRFLARYHINYVEEFKSDHGMLASPQFGHLYDFGTRMTWRIDGETTGVLKIMFKQFSVGRKLSNGACSRGRLTIADSNGRTDEFCGSSYPPNNTYSAPLTLALYAEGYRYPGFLLSWSIPQNESHTEIDKCKFVIQATRNSQILTSPNYPNFDPDHLDCEWIIETDQQHSLEIRMLNFSLENSPNCKYENFTVTFYGIIMSSWGFYKRPIQKVICGTPNMTTFGFFNKFYFNRIKISFKADQADFFPGFQLSYKLRCFQYIDDQIEGWLQNEEYPNAMSERKDCLYSLKLNGNRKFQLNVTGINLPPQTNGKCDNGYLEISYARISQRYCGSVVPTSLKPLNTNYRFIVIKLIGDFKAYRSYSGFQLKYSLQETEECGGGHYLSRPTDYVVINSPRKETNYSPTHIECLWKITGYAGSRFRIDFEVLRISGSCKDSYLAIYDGLTSLAPKIGNTNYCTKTNSIFSTGNQIFIKFKNNEVYTRFTIKIQISSCGGLLSKLEGVISSPNYPRNYPTKTNCIWTLNPGYSYTFSAKLVYLDLDYNCSKANLTFLNKEFDDELIWSNCNQSNRVFKAASNSVKVIFTTNTKNPRSGFQLNYKFSRLNCSGTFTDPSREIKSINYPGYLPTYSQCIWKIKVDISKRIVILIKKLEAGSGCFKIVGEITNFFKKICYTTMENVEIDTGASSVRILFHTNRNSRVWFSYSSDLPTLCGGHIRPDSNNTRIITITNVTSCNYVIHNFEENEGTVSINVVMKKEDCINKYIKFQSDIYSDSLTDYLLICENPERQNNFATPGKEVSLEFLSRELWYRRNTSNLEIEFKYKINRCGGLLQDSFGYIKSPNYPEKYPDYSNCEWVLKAPENMHIKLVIHTLHLESHVSCNFDYLILKYGPSFNSPVFRTYCGEHKIENETIIFRNNLLRISFHSDHSVSKDGFLIQYTYFDSVDNCNGIIHNISGSIKSPNYPRAYPSNLRCNWTVIVPEGYHIKTTFQLPFDLEIALGNVCSYDYLQIYDSNPDKLMRTICGNVLPSKPIFSSSNRIGFVFNTDYNHNLDGFHAVYEAVCGGIHNETYGIFKTASKVFVSSLLTKCIYLIPSWKNHRTLLSLKGNLRNCFWTPDHVQVFLENEFGEFELYRNICGIVDTRINFEHSRSIKIQYNGFQYSSSQHLLVASYFHMSNFKLYRNITIPKHISSSEIGTPYLHNLRLLWKFEAPAGYIFYIYILEMDIEPSPTSCVSDYLAIYNANSTNRQHLSSIFCGKYTDISPIKINSNFLTIEFVSDAFHFVNHTGFAAVVIQTPGPVLGCGGMLNVTSGTNGVITIVDLNLDGLYDNGVYCEWLLSAPIGNAIQVTFENQSVHMERRERNQCVFDSLTIYDGSYIVNPVLQIICEVDQVDMITSNSNNMLLVLRTDHSVNGRGFKIMYSSVTSNSHMLLTATNVSRDLSSPHYPNDTSYGFKLYANIEANNGSDHILVEVTDLKVRTSINCSVDQFIIQDISLLYVNKMRKICKSLEVPVVFISSNDKILIQYQIGPPEGSNNLAYKRFRLSYQIYNCNRTETAYSGSIANIESLKGQRYEHNRVCNLTLIAPRDGLKYQFYFKRFKVENSPTCNYDYVKFIYGKGNGRQYELPRLCGNNLPASFVSNTSQVSIVFVTDSSINHDGFDITYVINKDSQMKCGGDIELDSGAVTSPGFGQNYYEGGQCIWNIALLSEKRMKWRITHLEFGQVGRLDQSCRNNSDFVKITNENQFTKYCGKMIHPIESVHSSRTMRVEYKSANGGTGVGFRIQWETLKDSN